MSRTKTDILYLVIPCYNEEQVLPETAKRVKEKMESLIETKTISPQSRVLLVDDGSKDRTWALIEELHQQNPLFSGLKLSRNRGHQNAVLAGLMTAKEYADAVISMDADLQDDIHAIDGFLENYYQGCDIVYGVRSKRETDTFFKRFTAESFYKLLHGFGVDIIYNHADYRLMSKRALDALAEYKEVNLFLRGIVPLIGFKFATVSYERHERFAGESKYPLKKMLGLAFDGITSFSVRPIKWVIGLGVLLLCGSLLAFLYALISIWIPAMRLPLLGLYTSLFFCCSLILLALGIVGEYVGKIYGEVKARPRYFIDQLLHNPH